ncbi:acyltransferase domain-containing protein [Hahella sp. KA22]|uniref:type I polyketide synthase n=1 Tax=Hahella sp. KA22 TaxID=1628392 RepID=UPI000FDE3EB2|nr:type I polyketide synthase [Hahella sp. KA22]AZZ92512.1 acyltransferase domain-containing protein [Hahella sp. KA22]QAY55885.1 acyltransferase domain-containing protein [Hahella sp. KA22]
MKREFSGNEVAIIGISCRFPQSPDWRAFWRNLLAGRELVSFFSRDELLAAGAPSDLIDLPNYVPAKAALEDAECFDYEFFGYSQREAQKMDPQLRVLHEVSYNAFLDAGLNPGASSLNAGVFIGSTLNMERLEQFAGASQDIAEMFDVGNYNDPAAFATQIAYRMKLQGPAVHVQTACSTSLSAVHLACKSLLAGECDMALAGGACITDPVTGGYLYQNGMILSPDGHCKTFSDQGQGTVNGNGVGVVLLKLLEDALADGDPIHAVILESGMNNDGDRKVSFEAPSVQGQADVISRVYQLADIPFSSLGMIEAHGTATVLGDPIEIQALNKAAQALTPPEQLAQFRCAIGSVKSNMGHLDAAAGVAGLIKAALSVRYGKIPPTLHFNQPNPHLELDKTPFWAPTQAAAWPADQPIRRAGVSSFGIGGTNVHVLLEQPPRIGDLGAANSVESAVHTAVKTAETQTTAQRHILPLSASSPAALARLAQAYALHLDLELAEGGADLSLIVRQLQDNRSEYSCRAAFVATDGADWKQQLDAWEWTDGAEKPRDEQVWLFPGQGSQSPQMGLRLAAEFPEFGERYFRLLEQAAQLLITELGAQPGAERDALIERLKQPESLSTLYLQPLIYALQTALGVWLRQLGCQPAALCGFSLGEFAAAAVAGVFTPEEGMTLVVARARLMDATPKGAVFAVSCKQGFDDAFPAELWRVAELSPGTWTLATSEEGAAAAEAWLTRQGLTFKRVAVSHAFHTPLIESAARAFGEMLQSCALQPAQCAIFSTATGRKLDERDMCDPQYWVRQMLSPVQWGAALAEVNAAHPDALYTQIGTGVDLLQHARKWLRLQASRLTPSLGAAGVEQEATALRQFIAKTWTQGARIVWPRLHSLEARDQESLRSHLPGHAFERRVCAPLTKARSLPASSAQDSNRVASLFFGSHFYGQEWESIGAQPPERLPMDETPDIWIICRQLTQRERDLAQALETRNQRCGVIECGEWRGDFSRVHAELQDWLTQQGLRASAAMDVIVTGLLDDLDATQAQFWAFWLPVALARWSAAQPSSPRLRQVFPAVGMAAWEGTETLSAEKSQLLGPLLIAPEEYTDLSALCIDLASEQADGPDGESVAQALKPWLEHGWRGGQLYCLRRDAFWRRRVSARIQEQPLARALPDISRNSWVLITGANGGMGAAIAEHLAEVYHCHLLLLVRKSLPPRRDWAAEIARQSANAEFLQWVLSLEFKGGRVTLLQGDLGDEATLNKAFAPVFQLAAQGVGVDYVFHTAGRGEGAMMQMRSEAESLATLAPKVTGTRFLCDNLERLGKPTLLLFSSLGNLLPKEKVGQVAYVSANACLEAYAEQVRRRGGRALAIAWDDWAESGMATRSAQQLDDALKQPVRSEAEHASLWRRPLDARRDWWLDEHRMDAATTVMPAMGMVTLAYRAIAAQALAQRFSLHGVAIERPLVVQDGVELDVAVAFSDDHAAFTIFSGVGAFSAESWTRHATGKIRLGDSAISSQQAGPEPVGGKETVGDEESVGEREPLFRARDGVGVSPKGALAFGPRWRNVIAVDRVAPDAVAVQLQLPAAYQGEAAAEGLHVALLDTATLIASPEQEDAQYAPVSIGAFTQYAPMCDRVRSRVQVSDLGAGKLLQVKIYSDANALLVAIDDLLLVDASEALRSNDSARHAVMRLRNGDASDGNFAFESRQEPRREPGPLEVEIQVRAAGLNFKDVLIALGVLPAPSDPSMTFGQEAAGVVTRVGAEVTKVRVGDRVMCAGHSCLADHVLMPERVVALIPPVLGYQQAAGVPVAFTTAWIALKHAANLKRGERILIHSAAGGVGMAAMQIALHLGAEVWVTAGSEEKRNLLVSLGAQGTANSRTREFGDVFRERLGERPFQVILNALAGELLEESVSLLAPQGRFLELGLRDILQDWKLGLSIFAKGGSFHAVQAGAEHPAYNEAWSEVVALLEREALRPLPTKAYAARDIAEAFQFMAQGRHIGKIVIAMETRSEERSFAAKLREEGLSNQEGTRIALAMATLARQTSSSFAAVSKLPIGVVLEKQLSTQQMLFSASASQGAPDAADEAESLAGADAETLLTAMRAMLESFLGTDGLDVDASFFNLGATSLDLIQFAKRLEQRLAREIPVALLFKAASLRELSKELAPTESAPVDPAPSAQADLGDKRRALQARRKLRGASQRQESEVNE